MDQPDWKRMDFETAQPYWVLGEFPPEELPWVVCNEMLRGRDGDALVELAGLANPTRRDIGNLFERALEKLGIRPPSHDKAWKCSARQLAGDIVSGALSPVRGARQIERICIAADYPDELIAFSLLDDDVAVQWRPDEQVVAAVVQEARALLGRLQDG